jgi:hypothetical protein
MLCVSALFLLPSHPAHHLAAATVLDNACSYNKLENSSQDIRIDWIIRCWCKADLDLMCAAKNSLIIHLSTTEWDAETTGQLCRGEDWVIAEVSSTDQKCLHVLQDIGGEGDSTTQEFIPPEI